jgi:hypothetical protein
MERPQLVIGCRRAPRRSAGAERHRVGLPWRGRGRGGRLEDAADRIGVAAAAATDQQLAGLGIDEHVGDVLVCGHHDMPREAQRACNGQPYERRGAGRAVTVLPRGERGRRGRKRRDRAAPVTRGGIRRNAENAAVRGNVDGHGGIEDRVGVEHLPEQQVADAGGAGGVVADEGERAEVGGG